MLVDTHAHLCDPCFDGDRRVVLDRAREAGVEAIIAVGETLSEAEINLRLAAEYPGMVLPAAGLFPTILDLEKADSVLDLIRQSGDRLVAVGEVGLDLWKVKDPAGRELQREIFGRFIDLAIELDLPLNVHSRAAGGPTIDLLLERGATRVQLHAFDGRAGKALPAMDSGYFFSIPPSIVRSKQKQKLVRRLPLDCLLVETDSPVLGPTAEGRNEPANIRFSIEAIAQIKQLPTAEVIAAVDENARKLYGTLLVETSRERD